MTSPSGGNQYQQVAGSPGTPTGPKITSIFDFTEEALEQFAFWLEQRGLHIPVTQLLGFQQFTAQPASQINTQQTTTSVTYTDLATAGPTLTGLSDGKYVLFYGCESFNATGGNGSRMSVQVNATSAVDADEAMSSSTALTSVVHVAVKTLANGGNNTVTAKYRGDGGTTATFGNRWLVAIRYSNT